MTVDLHNQLRELCAVIDDEQTVITTDFIETRDDDVVILDRSTSRTLPVHRRWLVAVTVAVAVLVLVGGVALLFNLTGAETPVATSAQSWTRVPSNEAVFDQGWMSSVTAGGPGLVAVGSSGEASAAVWTSVDGITWSLVPHDPAIFGEAVLWSVAAGGPGLVAVGSAENHSAAVWTSADGITWSRVPHDDAVFPPGWMTSVTVGGPGLVAVGGLDPGAAVWTSVDGITWSRVPHDEAVFGSGVMNSVTAGGPGLVAVGEDNDDAAVWTSVDGLTWSRVPHDEVVFGGVGVPEIWGGLGFLSMASVTSGGPGLVAVGGDIFGAVVWTSVDGVTWSRFPQNEVIVGGVGMDSVTVGGPGLVAVGRSDDEFNVDLSTEVLEDKCARGTAYSCSAAVVWTSVDGITWSRVLGNDADFFGGGMTSVTAGPSGLVAVGADEAGAAVWVTEED